MKPADTTSGDPRKTTAVDAKGGGGPAATAPVLAPLTGRDTETGLLADRWDQAREGAEQVVLISGEAGLGKSRLVDVILQLVLDESGDRPPGPAGLPPVIEWRCAHRFQNSGLYPVIDQLERALAFRDDQSPADRFDALARYLEDGGLGGPTSIALFAKMLFLPPDERYPEPGLAPAREREETFRAIHDSLRARSRRQPLLFVVEDLQWIDASSLELLSQFLAAAGRDRILTVLTFRPDFRVPWPAAAHQTTLALHRLTRRQVATLMREYAGGDLPPSLVAQLYQRTGGVPLLVEEFGRMVRESDLFGRARAEEIPATLQQLVIGRLNRLSGSRETVEFAAVLRREFEYDTLAALVGMDEPALQSELAKLTGANILLTKGQPPRCEYRFKHALLEEAVYGAMEEPRRRQFHRRVAEVMEERFPECAVTRPELLAQHFTEAGLPDRAVPYWLRAGCRAHEQFANVEAISHLTKGLELLRGLPESPARDARELELLGPLGTAYIATRGYAAPEVGPVFERAHALAGRGGPTPQGFAMLRGYFAYHIVRGDFRLCTELAASAMEIGERLADPGVLMEALFLQALARFYRGDFAGARESCSTALANYDDRARTAFWAAQTGEDSGVAHRCYLALATWHLGFPERAFALNAEARELARALGHPFSLEYALHHTGWLHQHARLGPQAQAAGDEQMRIATEQGFTFWHASGALFRAAGLLLRGRADEGITLFQTGLDTYRATGAGLGLTYYLGILAEAHLRAGRLGEAQCALEEAFALLVRNDERFQEAELHRLDGELHLAMADEAAAEARFRRAIEIAARQGSRAWELRASVSLARLWHRQGRPHEAFTLLTPVVGRFGEGLDTPDLAEAAALLKELGNERMRDDIAAGIRYIRGCIPPPITTGPVRVDWRYVPSSTLGGDTMGYHWVDDKHLALYLIDVTGHGLDSALLAVTVTNVIRSGALAGADLRQPDQVLAALNGAFQGAQHARKYFTIWYGVYDARARSLTYASGGHPSAIVLAPGGAPPRLLPATGTVMGILPGLHFPAATVPIPPGARLVVLSDGVFEVRRGKRAVWDLEACIAHLAALSQRGEIDMDALLAHVRALRGSPQLDDDFSIVIATFAAAAGPGTGRTKAR